MQKFIPYEKLSKKEKRRLDAAKRGAWEISPVTRRPENPKAYNRKKAQREYSEYMHGAPSAVSGLISAAGGPPYGFSST